MIATPTRRDLVRARARARPAAVAGILVPPPWLGGENGRVEYDVTVTQVAARLTAVVPAATTWREFPTLWGQLLGEVWDCLHAAGIHGDCRNVMLYWGRRS